MAPSDGHLTEDKAVRSAAKYIADLTSQTRFAGRLYFNFLVRPRMRMSLTDDTNYLSWFYQGDGFGTGVVGIEHAIRVFCVRGVYVEGSLEKGEVPTMDQLRRRILGSVATDRSDLHGDDSTKPSVLIARLHTHNVGIVDVGPGLPGNGIDPGTGPLRSYEINTEGPSPTDTDNRDPFAENYIVSEGGETFLY